MSTIIQRLFTFVGVVFFFGCATLVSAADDQKLSDLRQIANAASSFESALPPLIASEDFWSASKVYFQLAVARGRLSETQAACLALSQSLDYYRRALVKDKLSLAYFGEMASDGSDDSEGMQEVRSRLGCEGARSAASSEHASAIASSR
jgi:hypothetical protein